MNRKPVLKLVVAAYAGIAYVVFALTFACLLGFLLNFGVVKTIDGGSVGPLWQSLLVNTGLIALFGLQHSLMARGWFKRWLTKRLPAPIERSTYVLASSLVIAVMVDLWKPVPSIIWHFEHPLFQAALYGVMLFGWLLVAYASFLVNHFELFGLRQAILYLQNRQYHPVLFKSETAYRVVRHPILLGTIIAIWATPIMTVGHLQFALLMTVYILIGSTYEERDLVELHGPEYKAYQRLTPKLIPLVMPRLSAPPSVRTGLSRLIDLLKHLHLPPRASR